MERNVVLAALSRGKEPQKQKFKATHDLKAVMPNNASIIFKADDVDGAQGI